MCKSYYLAIDIGASSGRHIVGWRENSEIQTDEVYRFPNGVEQSDGYLIWNMERLLAEVKAGIAAAKRKYPNIESLSIDTWAVDYVLLRGNEPVFPCYAYSPESKPMNIPTLLPNQREDEVLSGGDLGAARAVCLRSRLRHSFWTGAHH